MIITLNKKVLCIDAVLLLLTFACSRMGQTISPLKYLDEGLFIICLFILLIRLSGKSVRILKADAQILFLLGVTGITGFTGNLVYAIQSNVFGQFVDALGFVKGIIVFIVFKNLLDERNTSKAVENLQLPAKAFLIAAAAFGIVSLSVDLGMGGEERFGVNAFSFVFEHAHIFAIVVMASLIVIVAKETKKSKVYFYTFLACICQMLTTKGPSLIWAVIIFFMYRYYVHNKKIKLWSILLIAAVCLFLGGYQINNYFLNLDAPRALFIKYGVVTAKEYFPTGSGFATYGSDMAEDYYSPLYVKYGFNARYGMGPAGGKFLNDTYWPMVMAQFGYIGLLCMSAVFYLIFGQLQMLIKDRTLKALVIASYIYIMIHSLGSAVLTSAEGMILFFIFAVAVKCPRLKTYSADDVLRREK